MGVGLIVLLIGVTLLGSVNQCLDIVTGVGVIITANRNCIVRFIRQRLDYRKKSYNRSCADGFISLWLDNRRKSHINC